MDVAIRSSIRRKRRVGISKVKWWNLTAKNATKLFKKIKMEGKWYVERDANKMWEEMAKCIWRLAMEVLGASKGGSGIMKGFWW